MKMQATLGQGIALLALACGGGAHNASVEATTDTFRGAERLHYPAAHAVALDWSVDSIAAIGDAFGDEEYQFGNISPAGLAGDSAGNLYVLDTQARHVQKYGPDGRYLASFGRKGGGPGELEQPLSLALGPGDSLWIADFSNNRFTILPQDGGDARSIRFPENTFPTSGLVVANDRYTVADRALRFTPGATSQPEAEGIPVVAYAMDGTPRDTLWTAPEPKMDQVQLQAGGRVMVMLASRAFSPRLLFAAFSDGMMAVSDTADYLAALVSRDGKVREWIQRDPPPRATTDADREAERERVRRQSSRAGGPRIRVGGGGGSEDEGSSDPLLEQRLAKMTFEDVIPRIVNLAVDPMDRLWIGVSEQTPGEVERIDVYDHDGRLLGELHGVPFPDVFVGRDRMGVLTRDELDVPHIVLYRITPGTTAS